MRFHTEASRDAYDCIVVGSGIGGLSAAALLAKAGRRVLVVERHDRVGGYAHSFRRGRYVFDGAVHMVGGCEGAAYEGGSVVHRVLDAVGALEHCDFRRLDPFYTAVYPDVEIRAPGDLEEFVRVHTGLFPGERKGLRSFLQECLNIRLEQQRASELETPFHVIERPGRFPTLLRYRRATLAQALGDHVADPKLAAALATLWPYLGLPPSRVSFLYFATMLMSYLADGAYYCRGSFQRMADALADSVVERGGEVLLRSPVRRIRVEDGSATGVVLENGQRISAATVLSNADALQTVEELVGADQLPSRYVAGLRRLETSVSGFVVYAATDLPLESLGAGHESFVYSAWDHDASYWSTLRGDPSWLSITVPTLADPELAPEGEHLLVLTTLLPYETEGGWRVRKQAAIDRMLRAAGRRIPELERHLRFVEGGTPRTLERYTRNRDGALYGFALTPSQVGPGRPTTTTPIVNLHLVGHWTQPGGGIAGVVSSGLQAARAALGLHTESALWSALEVRA